jgi:hypothetical protein
MCFSIACLFPSLSLSLSLYLSLSLPTYQPLGLPNTPYEYIHDILVLVVPYLQPMLLLSLGIRVNTGYTEHSLHTNATSWC